jgi:hypothetical protein
MLRMVLNCLSPFARGGAWVKKGCGVTSRPWGVHSFIAGVGGGISNYIPSIVIVFIVGMVNILIGRGL